MPPQATLVFLTVLGWACGRSGDAPSLPAGPPLSESIVRIEQSLLPVVRVEGVEYRPWALAQRMEHYRVPGLSVAVIRDGKLAWTRAYGTTSNSGGAPVTEETLFAAGPLSMSVAAVVAGRLVDDGKLDLDKDINQLLNAWRLPSHGHEQAVTTRRILNHIAGFPTSEELRIKGTAVPPSLVDALEGRSTAGALSLSVDHRPGLRFAYSPAGYAIAQLVLEEVGDAELDSLARDLVWRPIGASRSSFSAAAPAAGVAVGHDAMGQVLGDPGQSLILAADGLWTTASDIARLLVTLQVSLDRERDGLLSSRTASRVLESGLSSQGLGFQIWTAGEDRFGASGGGPGTFALAMAYKERGEGAVILANGARGEMLARELLQAMAREYEWQEIRPWVTKPPKLSSLVPQVGKYQTAQGATVRLTVEEGNLVLNAGPGVFPGEGEVRADLYPVGGSAFAMIDRSERVTFTRTGSEVGVAQTLVIGELVAQRVGGG